MDVGFSRSSSRRSRLFGLLLFVLLIASAGVLSYQAHIYPYYLGDLEVTQWLQSFGGPMWDAASRALAPLGGDTVLAIVGVALVSVLLWLFRWRLGAIFVWFVLLGDGLNRLLKGLVARPRPDPGLLRVIEDSTSNSFPSGHIVHSLLLYGFLIYLVQVSVERWWLRIPVQIVLGLLILAQGPARVYLGAHWPSDVLGGYVVGGVLLWVLVASYRWAARNFIVARGGRRGS